MGVSLELLEAQDAVIEAVLVKGAAPKALSRVRVERGRRTSRV